MKTLVNTLLILSFIVAYVMLRDLLLYNTSSDKVVFLNVGTGDSILLVSGGDSLLVDGGDSYAYSGVLSKYINKKPWVLISTHDHLDHLAGLVGQVKYLTNYDLFRNPSSLKTFPVVALNNMGYINTYNINTNTHIKFKNFNISTLWPKESCENPNPNYCSLVLLVTHKNGQKILLMSDSEKEAQQRYLHLIGDVDVVKIPHQGSKDSLYLPLLEKAKPEYAVLSVGENNWGHPHKEVLSTYSRLNIKLYRTDVHGDIIVEFD